ncbi:MAG: hypothetical protein M3327_15450 [Actinomycetota bacterium]|nr:hypothetical protein [Actinomycetota bacterium]
MRDVERYLANVQNAQITETDPWSVTYRRRDDSAEPALPASEDLWRIQASGAGTQTISWRVEEGSGPSWR